MIKVFLDTYSLVEIALDDNYLKKYRDKATFITLSVNIAELYYYLLKTYEEVVAKFFVKNFSSIATSIPLEIIPEAMQFRYKHKKKKFSYVDVLAYTYAMENNMVFVTGDRAFTGMKNVEIIR